MVPEPDHSRVPSSGDLILAIETSNPTAHAGAAGVALGRLAPKGAEILAQEPLSLESRLDDDLMPAIDRLMRRFGAPPRGLAAIAVSVGPGGYTSVRIGVSGARMIARATGARTYAVPTAMVGAIAASREVPHGTTLAVCLAWKNAEAWVHRFRAGDPPIALDAGSIMLGSQIEPEAVIVVEPAFASHVSRAGSDRVVPIRVSASDVVRACAHTAPSGPDSLVPLYPREPEAVTKWRARGMERDGA